MILKKIQINGFGNIENKEIELQDGLNVIYGKNESGKSTLASFIKCIFYGINRNKAGNEFSEYESHKPWKNIEFSGKIEYECNGKKYTAFRDFNRNNGKIYDENGTDLTSEFSKDKNRGTEFGMEHLGIDEETFVNTLFVSQDDTIVNLQSQKNVIQKLTNILQSGQESISFEKIKSKLQKKSLDEIGTERTHNKPMNLIKKEIEEKEFSRNHLLHNRARKRQLEEKKESLENEIDKIEQNIDQIQQVLEIKEKYISLLEEKERTYELTQKIKEKEKQETIVMQQKQLKHALTVLIITTVIVACALLWYRFYWWTVIEILLALLGGAILKYTNKIKIPQSEEKDFSITKEELNKKEQKELEKLGQKGIKEKFFEKKAHELRTLLEGLEKNKNDYILEIHKIEIEEESLKESIERLSDIEEQLIHLEEKKKELDTRAKVIRMATEKLEESYEELKQEVIPELQKNIKEKIRQTTNGKYVNAIYNNEEGILVENVMGDLVPVNKLSMGTIDQMYLGFRFGLAEKMGDIPVILDESFAYYDDERLMNILLSFRNANKQIILLTCSQREKEMLEKMEIPYHFIAFEDSNN